MQGRIRRVCTEFCKDAKPYKHTQTLTLRKIGNDSNSIKSLGYIKNVSVISLNIKWQNKSKSLQGKQGKGGSASTHTNYRAWGICVSGKGANWFCFSIYRDSEFSEISISR